MATAFTVGTLNAGTKCVVGGTPDSRGWSITLSGNRVYAWSQWQGGTPSEVGGPLTALALGPGTYQVWVDGGTGAQASINFALR